MKKALRLRRLANFVKYNKEDKIFEMYERNQYNFELIQQKMIFMELEI